ncbi:bifunctional 4-hydroxy-2-oxoglutarate aldolase/2-dehydro-3-deoxy-phosphogluconate aldolase [Micromonospora echinofusca]|uniref:Aldolase n=1 Tax=Micromonospora echinofusca TaxID=47858 RepID=A0ABS3VW66_MICEH|nr:bifunctional 4-hydroxy-2-oxoglutarate aldolase/2-dehydro-3-deoxy-phosphogluconate aldolase [Micromonospora echinofusca]MBO4208623.1 aldolase [Micromonospora echinofusca]
MNLCELLETHRLMAVVPADEPEPALASIRVLVDAGVRLIEVPLTSRDAVGVLLRAHAELGGDAVLGAGSVLTDADVVQVEQAGGAFVVTPALVPAVAESVRLGLPALVGALTPAEVVSASLAGATAVKLFPASLGGPDYLRTLREPFPTVPFVPVGGVDLDAALAFLDAGALAVGVGAPLLGDAPHGGDLAALRRRVTTFRSALG